ncbi:S1/P1 nuclease [Pseudenhygromyxa sp. WMMC2535]|uniref:S1/P1 nuclease n=1 Tax=Pseudenhygromyxa sp. WMMC2535 TaxID=2712867 RepID=UPI001553D8F9|nr:S1/P1 nuclease [Pseudenhygromyxa sp. WMMC2535]NVB36373.1 S1/P1 nuclease [Pseudenhygromyxa sp. WMMC2535]
MLRPNLDVGRRRAARPKRRWLAFGLCLAALTPSTAHAWWDDGHRIVGEIAERNLSEDTRAKVRELLADTPEYTTLATASTWADQVARQVPELAFVASSHYVNLGARLSPRELHQLCLERSGCVATGMAYYAEILRSQRASKAERAEALRLLAHFVGDAHQPLHAGHAEDRGGNDINELRMLEFTPAKERTNLHAVWDGGFVAIHLGREGIDWQTYAQRLDERVTPEARARWGRGSVYDWLEESRLIGAAEGYLHADGITPIRSGDTLGEDWYQRNLPVAEQRLQQAGLRLALVLEEVLGEG